MFPYIICLFSIFFGGVEGAFAALMNTIYHLMMTAVVIGFTWIWTRIGVLLVMKSSRANEYEADEFSFRLGYGNELCAILESFSDTNANGLFASLVSSHPDKNDRIARIQELGTTYVA